MQQSSPVFSLPESGVFMRTEVFFSKDPLAISMVAHTVATALGPSVTSCIKSAKPTNITAHYGNFNNQYYTKSRKPTVIHIQFNGECN